jgi:L-threonylcarbamoyladenylate synthase
MKNLLDDLNHISALLREGAVILCPTDTIWGLSCDAFNQESVEKIYKIKKRDLDKPLILLVDSIEMLKKYIRDIHPRVETLIVHYERPMSVIYMANHKLPSYLVNADGSIAIRVTYDPMLQELIGLLRRPIVSTSANLQSEGSPKTFADINPIIKQSVDYVFQTRRKEKNSFASIIIKFNEEGELLFLR